MDLQYIVQRLHLQDRRNLYLALSAPIVALTAATLIGNLVSSSARRADRVIRSPRQSLQLLSAERLEDVPYPPNALPGGRDVDTPYGNIRVYEWGPQTGKKILFVHGISTPCIAFASMAKLLVDQGYRVMLFDLFGRGYSDAPDPAQYHQDAQLFTSQILLVLASSELAWTGPEKFSLVGYSLGGGISATFTSYFPQLIESLVLIAPAGLIRPGHFSTSSKLLYGGLLPESVVNYFIYRRLKGRTVGPLGNRKAVGGSKTTPAQVAEAEVPAPHPALAADSMASLFPNRPGISPANAVGWQVDAHPGFLASFISSIKHAPIANQHERWKLIGRRQEAQRASSTTQEGLEGGKVLILLGKQDSTIISDELAEDATKALGRENVQVVKLEGGHDVPIVNAQGCVDAIVDFWSR